MPYERAARSRPDRSWLNVPADHRYDVVAIAASAGGLGALTSIIAALPADFPVPVLVVLHRSSTPSHLELLIGRRAKLQVRTARAGDRLEAGTVHIAPGGCHTTVGPAGLLTVTKGGPIAFVRPSANLMFSSVGQIYGERAIGCVLTGMGSDGAAGITELRRRGGFIIAQRPRSSAYPGMPASAIETRKVDLELGLDRIAFALCVLTDRASVPV